MTIFDKVKGFKDNFGVMIRDDKVVCWEDAGLPRPLTDDEKDVIKRLEEGTDCKVYAVLDNTYAIGDENVRLISYLYTDDDECDISVYQEDPPVYYAMAKVVNINWGFEEMGSVLITPGNYGGPRRIG